MSKPGHYPEGLARIGTNCQLECAICQFSIALQPEDRKAARCEHARLEGKKRIEAIVNFYRTKDTGFNGNASSGSLATFELDNIFKNSDQFRSDPNFRRNSMIRLIGSQANLYHTFERCLQHENQLYKSYAIGQGEISLTATKINVDQLAILAKYRPTLDILQAEREGKYGRYFCRYVGDVCEGLSERVEHNESGSHVSL
ncbi:hypothetical protein L596_030683 [Steinernema carpocapsae]|uniref:Uncharacterized protein n=1 Tax=Steinernema carpocapsae TaxID=34508 RepID=A0A4U5LQ59_STECR|nr:hypothetical protein L596_030683 [Steinernema carpocapsae]